MKQVVISKTVRSY